MGERFSESETTHEPSETAHEEPQADELQSVPVENDGNDISVIQNATQETTNEISVTQNTTQETANEISVTQNTTQETAGSEKRQTILESHGFTIGETIGNGTYAVVKLAYSERHASNVAIKIIDKRRAPADYLAKFLPRETELIKGLTHPNIICFLHGIETTHRMYIIMEYAENGSLLDIIRTESHIDEARARKWFQQLADAILYCHNRGILHRDIKCENLVMDHSYNMKLSDFGFARTEPEPSTNGLCTTFCGSYAYASPEILRGIPYDAKLSDVWSMGVVLYAMVYGRLPFDDTNYGRLLKQVQRKVQFREKPYVSASCKSLISRILAPLRVRLPLTAIISDTWLNEERQASSVESGIESERHDQAEAAPVAVLTDTVGTIENMEETQKTT